VSNEELAPQDDADWEPEGLAEHNAELEYFRLNPEPQLPPHLRYWDFRHRPAAKWSKRPPKAPLPSRVLAGQPGRSRSSRTRRTRAALAVVVGAGDPPPAGSVANVCLPDTLLARADAGKGVPAELEPFLDAFVDMIVEDLLALPPEPKP
jgi:hypothetical protein